MGAMMNPNQAAATVADYAGGMMFRAEQIQSVVQAAHSDGQVVVMVMSVEAAQGLLGFQALSRAGRQKFLTNASVGGFWASYKPNERPHGAVKRGPIGLATRRIDRTACHQPSSSRDFGRADRVPVSVVTSRPSGAPPIPIGAPAMKQTGVVPDPRRLLPSAPTIASPNPHEMRNLRKRWPAEPNHYPRSPIAKRSACHARQTSHNRSSMGCVAPPAQGSNEFRQTLDIATASATTAPGRSTSEWRVQDPTPSTTLDASSLGLSVSAYRTSAPSCPGDLPRIRPEQRATEILVDLEAACL
jgi:hypothetical protein